MEIEREWANQITSEIINGGMELKVSAYIFVMCFASINGMWNEKKKNQHKGRRQCWSWANMRKDNENSRQKRDLTWELCSQCSFELQLSIYEPDASRDDEQFNTENNKRIKSDNSTKKHTHTNLIPFCSLFICHIQFVICTVSLFIFSILVNLSFVYSYDDGRWYGTFLYAPDAPPLIRCQCFSFHLNGMQVSVVFFRFYGTYFIPFYRCINVGFFTVYSFLYQNKKKCIKLFHFAVFGV